MTIKSPATMNFALPKKRKVIKSVSGAAINSSTAETRSRFFFAFKPCSL